MSAFASANSPLRMRRERSELNRSYSEARLSVERWDVVAGPPASLAEQLKQVLAERERRLAAGSSPQPDAVQLTNDLVDEIRQAVSEANARGET